MVAVSQTVAHNKFRIRIFDLPVHTSHAGAPFLSREACVCGEISAAGHYFRYVNQGPTAADREPSHNR